MIFRRDPIDINFAAHDTNVCSNFCRGRTATPKGNRRRKVNLEPELEVILDALIKSKKGAPLRSELLKPAAERREGEGYPSSQGGLCFHDANQHPA